MWSVHIFRFSPFILKTELIFFFSFLLSSAWREKSLILFYLDPKLLKISLVKQGLCPCVINWILATFGIIWIYPIMHTINWKVSLTLKKCCRNAAIVLSILIKNRIDHSIFLKFLSWASQDIWGQRRPTCKKVGIWPNKKITIHQLFKTRICAFKIQRFEAIARRPPTFESQTTDLKFELLLGRNWT